MRRAGSKPALTRQGRRPDRQGFSLLEVLIALTVFSTALLAIAQAGFVTSQTLRSGRSYVTEWAAAQSKLDSLAALGWAALDGEAGKEVVNGHTVSWTAQGENPRRITLVVHRRVLGVVTADTFMTYVAERN